MTAKLTRERVLDAAMLIADEDGLDALTMRRLADELGAGAMSVYHHVPSKDGILDGILERVVGEMELPSGPEWKSALRRAAMSAHEALGRHPWAAAALLGGERVSPARLRHTDAILGCLRGAGFTDVETDLAYHVLDSHIMGFSLWLAGISAGLRRLGPVFKAYDLFDASELPHLAEHIEVHLREDRAAHPSPFAYGLDLILDGLERQLAARARSD
jgi:AcrR family transcriptional regulator